MQYDKNLYPFTSKWMEIDGARVHYIDEGEGPVLIFSHPALGSSFMYREFIKRLRPRCRCIAIDYPGFGLSDSIEAAIDISAQSRILKTFIQRLGIQDIYVLGHDTGGPAALMIAVENPTLFRGLILTDTIIFPVSEYRKISIMLGIVGSRVFQWLNARTNLLVRLTFRFGVTTRKLSSAERHQYRRLFGTRAKRRHITRALRSLKLNESFMKTLKKGFETFLQEKPILLMYGENDPVHRLGISSRIENMMPDSELTVIDREGHFPHEGQPEFMSASILYWIEKIERRVKLPIENVAS